MSKDHLTRDEVERYLLQRWEIEESKEPLPTEAKYEPVAAVAQLWHHEYNPAESREPLENETARQLKESMSDKTAKDFKDVMWVHHYEGPDNGMLKYHEMMPTYDDELKKFQQWEKETVIPVLMQVLVAPLEHNQIYLRT